MAKGDRGKRPTLTRNRRILWIAGWLSCQHIRRELFRIVLWRISQKMGIRIIDWCAVII